MKISNITFLMRIGILAVVMSVLLIPITVFAWGDNSEDGKGRPSYTIEEINNGAIGATPISDGENYKNSDNYPGQIIFNTISDNVIGNEKNFVAARECVLLEDGSWEGATKDTVWNANNITVEDGKYYVIRLYVHNNNPNGWDGVAENTTVRFQDANMVASTLETVKLEDENGKETGETKQMQQVQINGFISSSNATPSEYWDYVNFNAEVPFHLEYIQNSALLENNGIGEGGFILDNDIIDAEKGGTLIGYDALDGRVPGCYEYANYVTIKVKIVYDYDFTVEKKVRLAGEKEWKESVDAKVGDKVEFQIKYKNTSDEEQTGVVLKDTLPSNLRYVAGSSEIKNASHPKYDRLNKDYIVTDGLLIGDYISGSNAFVCFTAEVVDDNLACGKNTLVNWVQAGVGSTTEQDNATVVLYKNPAWFEPTVTALLVLIVSCLIAVIILWFLIIKKRRS